MRGPMSPRGGTTDSSRESDSPEACRRASAYLDGLRGALTESRSQLENAKQKLNIDVEALVDAVYRYLGDSEYYLNTGDCLTALVAVSYAEGLLDSLRYLGLAEIPWHKRDSPKRVFVAGTFDLLHPGHIALLRFASNMGKVYVVVSRDVNAAKTKKRPLVFNENNRLKIISSLKYVYDARLGDPQDILKPVENIRPDIIVLGPDQPFDEEKLADLVEARTGKRPNVVRFQARQRFADDMSSSSDVIRHICESICPALHRTRSDH